MKQNVRAVHRQSKVMSTVETLVKVITGYISGVLIQLIIFPFYGIDVPISTNMTMGLFFVVSGFIVSYLVRRLFNRIG